MKSVTKLMQGLLLLITIALNIPTASGQQVQATLQGRVVDELGGLIVGAAVSVREASGTEKAVTTNAAGVFVISGLKPGLYTVTVTAPLFAPYEHKDINLVAGPNAMPEIRLTVAARDERVDVVAENRRVTTNADDNTSATVLKGTDLNVLSDDPDQLAADLQALAASEGPNTQLIVDGFTNVRVPPKSSIREVRINANPFTAEQDSFGIGRVEIFTKPGSDAFHGQGFFNFNDESLNGRNPFATTRAPYQARLYGGNVSGPIIRNKASFFVDFEQRRIFENAVVNATVLDDSFNIVPFNTTVVTPQRRTSIAPRFDYLINPNNTLTVRYSYLTSDFENVGIGGFALPSTGYDSETREHVLQVTDVAVLGPKTLNELRFQYYRNTNTQTGDATEPVINVQEAFIGGGAPLGLNSTKTVRFELSDIVTRINGAHTLKFGGRVRRVHITDISSTNFNGTFVFNSLEQFRRAELGLLGARPSQFSLAGGEPQQEVKQADFGGFVLDDWKMRPNFTLSAGLRYEYQTNISDSMNFGPRVSFAWSPWNSKNSPPKTVIRGGAGIFFGRVTTDLRLLDLRYNGINQQNFIVRDPGFYPNVPTIEELAGADQKQTIWRVVDDPGMPWTFRAAFSIERDLPYKTKVSANVIYRADRGYPRALNVNAPFPGTFNPLIPGSGTRPFPDLGNIFEFETTGISNKPTLLITGTSNPHKRVSIFGRFVWSKEKADNESAYSFPANSYDPKAEYGAVSFDIRTNGNLGVNYTGPWGLTFASLVRFASANKFNITIGRDINGDAVFTDRPAFATDLTKPGVIVTPFGAFDTNPAPDQAVIPPYIGPGSTLFFINLRAAKTISFGTIPGPKGKPTGEKRYTLTFTMQIQNLLNHTNAGPVIGNLSSPLFGLPNVSATSPRRIDFQARFAF
jgi:hypothetical protein